MSFAGRGWTSVFAAFLAGAVAGLASGRWLLPSGGAETVLFPSAGEGREAVSPSIETEVIEGPTGLEGKGKAPSSRTETCNVTAPNSFAILEGLAVAETPEPVPLAGMKVELHPEDDSGEANRGKDALAVCRTDENGCFVLGLHGGGRVRIRLLPPRFDFCLVERCVSLVPGETTRLQLTWRPRMETRIMGRVVTHEGEPVAGAEVTIDRVKGGPVGCRLTNGLGEFEIPSVKVVERLPPWEETREALNNDPRESVQVFVGHVFHPGHCPAGFSLSLPNLSVVPEVLRKEIRLKGKGFVSGTVRTADGNLLGDEVGRRSSLKWCIRRNGSSSSSGVYVRKGRFSIDVGNCEKGTLTVGGKSGAVHFLKKVVGKVSPETRTTGVEVVAEPRPEHRIYLLDESGRSLSELSKRFQAYLTRDGGSRNDGSSLGHVPGWIEEFSGVFVKEHLSVEDGDVRVFLDFDEPRSLHLLGIGFVPATVRIDPKYPPASLVLERAPPLVRGFFVLPAGKTVQEVVSKMVDPFTPFLLSRGPVHFDELDPATGTFAVARPIGKSVWLSLTLRFELRGYKSWKKKFRVKAGETVDGVRVEFEKEE